MSEAVEQKLDAEYVMNTFGPRTTEFVSGHGMYLVDDAGKEYLDFLAGIAVNALGYAHPALTAALRAQVGELVHVSNYFLVEHRGEVARAISELANTEAREAERTTWKSFFGNSGAEANECALKLARRYQKVHGTGANTVICLNKGFHGRTMETLSATMQGWAQDPFQPLPGGFCAVDANDVEGLKAAFAAHEGDVAAVMLEAVQGESGVHPMTAEFMRAVRELTRAHGALMICDEVQCGLFRTGKPFGFQLTGVTPDIFTIAKSVAGGIPCGVCAARAEVADAFEPGQHGSTFGGGPVACAAAEVVLAELSKPGFADHVQAVGAFLQEKLASLPQVTEVRGAGLIVAADLVDGLPDAHELVAAALKRGLVINATGPKTLRFLPPLICETADVEAMIEKLSGVLDAA